MSARWTIYLRESSRGWEWTKNPDQRLASWWGFYKTDGLAKGAAKRSVTPVVGAKTNPDDYAFVYVNSGDRS